MKTFQVQLLLLVYGIGVLGAFLQIAGAQWDVSWHILGIVETFFTPAHAVLYAGIDLVALANLQGLRLRLAYADNPTYTALFTGLRIAFIATALQIIAAPIDFWWHSTYGFDPYLFTPAHSLLITGIILGGVGMTIGIVRLLQAQRTGLQITERRWLVIALVVFGLATVWAQLNFFGYWITDVNGMAYTFGYCNINQFNAGTCGFANDYSTYSNLISFGIFAAAGTLVFWSTKRVFPRKIGMITLVALILTAIYAGLAIGFSTYALEFMNPPGSFYLSHPTPAAGARLASFIPVYLFVLVPVLALDLMIRNSLAKRKLLVLLLSAVTGPILAFVDGRFALGISEARLSSFGMTVAFAFMISGGVVGGLILTSFAARLSLGVHVPQLGLRTGPITPGQSPIR